MSDGQICTAEQLETFLGSDFRRGVLIDADLGCVRAIRLVAHSPYANMDHGDVVHYCVDARGQAALLRNQELSRPVALWMCVGTRHFLRGPFYFDAMESVGGGQMRAILRYRGPPLQIPAGAPAGGPAGAPAGAESSLVPFRSALEAQWQRVFAALQLQPRYEPCTLALERGSYTPDFSIRVAPFASAVLVEIKPAFPCDEALGKCEWVARTLGHPILLLWGDCALPFCHADPDRTYRHARHAKGWLFHPSGDATFPAVFLDDAPRPISLGARSGVADRRWCTARIQRAFCA